MLSTEVLQDPANGWSRNAMSHFTFTRSDILRKFFPVSFHAATDEGTPQKISPQDTPTNGLTCQCNQTSLHHNLYRFAFLSEPYYASVGNCKLLSGRGSLFWQWGQREVHNLDYVTE